MSIRQRLDGIVRIPIKYGRPDPPCPKSVKIELTPNCNYHCQYCGYSFRPASKRVDMDFDLFKRITKEMVVSGVDEIGLFYIGEPFMSPRLLVDAIKYLKKDLRVPYIFITSNGSLANKEIVEECMVAGLDSLKWSVNAADSAQAKELLGVNESVWKASLQNIKDAYLTRKKGYNTKIYASSIRYDENQAEKMTFLLYSAIFPFVDEHYWLPLYTMGGVSTKKSKELGYQPVAGNPGRCDSPVDPIPCWTLFTAAHVLSDGRLTACCMDATGRWAMGDLKEQGFMECWNAPEFQELRAEHLKRNVLGTVCEKCALVK